MSRYETLKAGFSSEQPPRSLYPLLWIHGDPRETEEALRREIAAMDEGGSGGFIIESRPHADYLGDGWWRDVGICLDEASKRGMEVWLFDEEYFPSGIAGGKVLEGHPEYRMQVLVKESLRLNAGSEDALNYMLATFTELLKAVCVKAADGERCVLRGKTELSEWLVVNRSHTWQVELYGIKPSWSGRMHDKMVDYFDPAVTDRFLSLTYEASKEKFAPYWGTTIKGFFGDETSFENFGSYDVLFGEETPCFPWSRVYRDAFFTSKGYDLVDRIERLWSGEGEQEAELRFDYMDVMTTLFSDNFFGRCRTWCQDNGVAFIGHVIEDNHAHMHHGYGVGHFFRTTRHFAMGGYDFVLRQVDSDQKRTPYAETYPQFKVYRDEPYRDFYNFTLAKLAQSSAHLEVGTNLVMCECFGAYGWDLGLREMKWLTDWMTARGTNWLVPHAFSPLFPDPDCPPHFFGGGQNPQWPFYRQWANYANRSCLMIKDGAHVANVAILYPAESHWRGDKDELDRACRTLTEKQIDFDILSMDVLSDEAGCLIGDGRLKVRKESFDTLLLPGIVSLPATVGSRIDTFLQAGGIVLTMEQLEPWTERHAHRGIVAGSPFPDLRYCHYRHEDAEVFFLTNESMERRFDDIVVFPAKGQAELWHPMDGSIAPAYTANDGDSSSVPIALEPYEAVFVVFKNGSDESSSPIPEEMSSSPAPGPANVLQIANWTVTGAHSPLTLQEMPPVSALWGLGDWSRAPGWDSYCGTVVYETAFNFADRSSAAGITLDLGEVVEIAEVTVNGHRLPSKICPPYRWDIQPNVLRDTNNEIVVSATNTLGSFFREDSFRRSVPSPSGLIGPVRLIIRE